MEDNLNKSMENTDNENKHLMTKDVACGSSPSPSDCIKYNTVNTKHQSLDTKHEPISTKLEMVNMLQDTVNIEQEEECMDHVNECSLESSSIAATVQNEEKKETHVTSHSGCTYKSVKVEWDPLFEDDTKYLKPDPEDATGLEQSGFVSEDSNIPVSVPPKIDPVSNNSISMKTETKIDSENSSFSNLTVKLEQKFTLFASDNSASHFGEPRLSLGVEGNERIQDSHRCRVCEKVFRHKYSLLIHEKVHSDLISSETPFSCGTCRKGFHTDSQLQAHCNEVHSKPYKCTKCDKKFDTDIGVQLHSQSHSRSEEERPYNCPICEKSFKTSDDVRSHHRQVHSIARPHVCGICMKGFKRRPALNQHMVRCHAPARCHKCNVCGRVLKSRQNLKTHELMHVDEKQDKCYYSGVNKKCSDFQLK